MEQRDVEQLRAVIDAALERHLASVHEEIAGFREDTARRFATLEEQVASIERDLKSIRRDFNDLADKVENITGYPARPKSVASLPNIRAAPAPGDSGAGWQGREPAHRRDSALLVPRE